jgi:hypothetical protein
MQTSRNQQFRTASRASILCISVLRECVPGAVASKTALAEDDNHYRSHPGLQMVVGSVREHQIRKSMHPLFKKSLKRREGPVSRTGIEGQGI